jgi:urease accessory protein
VIGETFSHGTLESRLEVWVDDEPRLIERQHLSDGDLTPVAGHPWLGTLLFYPAKKNISTRCANGSHRWEILRGQRSPTICCRCVFSHDNLICQRVMRDIWQSLRPLLTTKTACSPRIWQT